MALRLFVLTESSDHHWIPVPCSKIRLIMRRAKVNFYRGNGINPEIPLLKKKDLIILLGPGALPAAHPDRIPA
jgi:hypothetical protein